MLEKQITDKTCVIEDIKKKHWNVNCSTTAKNCRNYIREIVDNLDLNPNPEKRVIALSIGDPTVYGNLGPPPEACQAVIDAVQSSAFNGYAPSTGYEKSRQAVASYLTHDGATFTSQDIILCSGCSSSLEIAITALCDHRKKHNLIIPKPGFSIYRTLAEAIGVSVRFYNLIPDKSWEVDLIDLQSQIDENTAAIVLNNPSNPCGSVYSAEHLKAILDVALFHQIPVIADEIYERLVFSGQEFVSTASLNSGVPLLICGGLAKRFLAPGWRLGWIAVHDSNGAFKENIRGALTSLSQRTIGSNTLIQGALPDILLKTPQKFFDDTISVLEKNAAIAFHFLQKAEGLIAYMPQGTMYMMVKVSVDNFPFASTKEFVIKLMEEESVFCLPGSVSEFMRIVLTIPEELLVEACQNIVDFCSRWYKLPLN